MSLYGAEQYQLYAIYFAVFSNRVLSSARIRVSIQWKAQDFRGICPFGADCASIELLCSRKKSCFYYPINFS